VDIFINLSTICGRDSSGLPIVPAGVKIHCVDLSIEIESLSYYLK
jgi:hypothetical protein